MNSKACEVKAENLEQLQQQTKQSKRFVQGNFQIDYINSSKIMHQLASSSPDVRVQNFLCYQQGQILSKVTEVIYEDKLIRIEDKFIVSVDSALNTAWACLSHEKIGQDEKKTSRNIQKVRMFNKSQNCSATAQRRDKKNIVKNVVKMFHCWLEKQAKRSEDMDLKLALTSLEKMLREENYNNRLIKNLVSSLQINKWFLNFLEGSAQQQIKSSRIQDKESHYQALQIYKNLLSNVPENGLHDPSFSLNELDSLGQASQYQSISSMPRQRPIIVSQVTRIEPHSQTGTLVLNEEKQHSTVSGHVLTNSYQH